ncbi:MAG: dicarboxylate/amino acid:cation symporter [Candidatus Delongbacteria bacterium]|nr:dicarboxylate/amino acid:cation symporter [Candidatus Delongbacteria bacterium]MBN2835709.1 dicarboxylate/amino acid:cation symporter [Candidatus Delongbacteria bacterium]
MEVAKKKMGLTTQIFIGLIVGLIFGIILNIIIGKSSDGVVAFLNSYVIEGFLNVVGKLFINAIRMLVVPLVLVSLICGVAGIGDIKKLGRVGGKTLIFYLITTALAITLALIVASVINPGAGLALDTSASGVTAKEAPALSQVIINIVPSNPFKAMVDGEMLQVIFFAMLIGIAIAAVGKKVAGTLTLFEELNAIVMKMISLIMLTAPFGIFCLIAKVFATQGFAAFLPLLKYMITVMLVLIIHLLLVYTSALKLIGRLSPIIFFKKFYSTMLVAFSTSSSNATIPVTMSTVEKKMGTSRSIASFSIPFGATINMDGTAIMQGVAVVFIAQVYGINLTISDFLLVIATATLASVGTAGVPGVGLITLSMVLTQVGLPVEGIALIMGIDRLLDMSRTAVNISGDAIVALIVAKSEGEFDESVWNDPEAGLKDDYEELKDFNEKMNQNQEFIEKLENEYRNEEN